MKSISGRDPNSYSNPRDNKVASSTHIIKKHLNICYISAQSPHSQLHHRKSPRTDRHSPDQRRPNPLPEPPPPLRPPRLPETIPHIRIPLLPHPKPIALHLTLDHVERVTRHPQRLPGNATVKRHLGTTDLLPRVSVARHVTVHQVLERQEPDAVGLGFAEQGHGLAAVESGEDAGLGGDLADAVEGPGVEALGGRVGLGLQSDADMFDGAREDGVG